MPDLDQTIEKLRRMRAQPETAERDWYRVNAKSASRRAEVHIYDDIGWMGTSAKSLASELKSLDVDEIELHLNSPGGDAWDGIAIYNSLRDHKANVTVVVDGVAASAASVIAMAGDTVRMNRGAQIMIHDAWGLVVGNSGDMNEAAAMFDKLSDGMAEIYASRAGGSPAEWREAMATESWYSAAEAVDAGLADELIEAGGPEAKARWDIAAFAFAHAGRSAAPAPRIPTRVATSDPAPPAVPRPQAASTRISEGAGRMDPVKIREALGLQADASDDEVKAALKSSGLVEHQPDPPEPTPDPNPRPEPTPDRQPELVNASSAPGTVVLASSVWEQTQKTIKDLTSFVDRTKRDERDAVIAKAVEQGRFTPAQKPHFARLWDADPDGTRKLIDNLVPNSALAVMASGYDTGSDDAIDREYAYLFPPTSGGRRG